ncbi:hypothetical protein H0H81_006647 [Sphagnurus paluster]|uniref:Uncharacterized protein n=1 Tax=Sphagnurus paluster TaxID=117069 RepID=A0A9P7GMG9_9AGAR|nr:hypothetical protein H0H81_006647 [Sphagnurus paluster]
MRFTSIAAILAIVPALVMSSPIPEPEVAERALGQTGSYTISGLGARKKQLSACGANDLDLAIAMLEYVALSQQPDLLAAVILNFLSPRTDKMSTDYKYGDGKTYDSANFGVFKQNWGMLRGSTGRYKGKTANDYNTGAEMNSNLCLDISLRHESQNFYGESKWFAGHRNGASGLSNPNTQDIQNYKDAVYAQAGLPTPAGGSMYVDKFTLL